MFCVRRRILSFVIGRRSYCKVDTPKDLLTKVDGGIRTITFNTPDKLNAISLEMYRELAKMLNEANTDDKTRIVALTGTGKFFTSGNLFANFHSSTSLVDKVSLAKRVCVMSDCIRNFVDALIDLKKPLFALVNGPSIGIGVTILGLFDGVYSAKSAYFTTPFTILGACPEACSSYTFPRIMGHARAAHILMLNAKLSAEEAFVYGIVTKVFKDEQFETLTQRSLQATNELSIESLMGARELLLGPHRKELHEVNRLELAKIEKLLLTDESIHACEMVVNPKSKKKK